ncbi:cell envelope biogenesis protein TolA [Morganella morganii]|uniref:cell envelope biogenesis protein TolA n=1 Tax=Morganella morganii TaxID=582 RepID=UPI003EBBDEF1
MANELVVIEPATALDLFTAPDKVKVLLSGIREKALAEQALLDTDLSKAKNRDAIKSLAYKVTQSKTYIDNAGKAVVDELKELPKKVDASRKLCRDELDSLREEIRRPVTAWEAQEEARKQAEEAQRVADELARLMPYLHAEALEMNAECDRLIAEKKAEEERKRIEHENEIKRQAAEQARIEAEQKAQRDREAAELKAKQEREAAELKARQEVEAAAKREREAREAQERAEREKQEAIAKAEREKLAAVEAERRKAEEAERARLAEIERQKQEELKRQENKEHQRQFNREALQALIAAGFDDTTATKFLEMVIKGEIPHLSMNY